MSRALVWRGLDAWRAEYSDISLHAGRLLARGVQIGVEPLPYKLSYALDTATDYDTAHLSLDASGSGWSRRLDLRRDAGGVWELSADARGRVDLPEPGGDPAAFAGARDCDIQNCPLTNTMPVLREGLLRGRGPVDLVMAWVSVPALGVTRSEQRYEPIDTRRVRYVSQSRDFVAELELDDDGLVLRYPQMAERVPGLSSPRP